MPVKENISIAVVQTLLYWENIDANLTMFSELLSKAKTADLYILPEMFTTGFSMQPQKYGKESYEKGLSWLKRTAKEKQAAIVASMMVRDNENYYNRLFFVTPSQDIFTYDKKHLFGLGNEQQHYTSGKEQLIVDYLGWKIHPLICYDLRFPVWSRNTVDYDLLLYVANWPQKRINHWRSLLIARAIENQCYVAACNRIGDDANGIAHNGNSIIVEYSGEVLAESIDEATILYQNLSKSHLLKFKKAFPFLGDKDKFKF